MPDVSEASISTSGTRHPDLLPMRPPLRPRRTRPCSKRSRTTGSDLTRISCRAIRLRVRKASMRARTVFALVLGFHSLSWASAGPRSGFVDLESSRLPSPALESLVADQRFVEALDRAIAELR